jgi:hypothetical protein
MATAVDIGEHSVSVHPKHFIFFLLTLLRLLKPVLYRKKTEIDSEFESCYAFKNISFHQVFYF